MRIVLAGAGEVGTHLARLLSRKNHEIVVMDPSGSRLRSVSESCDLLTIEGRVTSLDLLTEAGVVDADLFIGVTPNEDTNMAAAMLAKKLGARFTVARIDNNEYLQRENRDFFVNLGVDSLIFPERVAAREVADVLSQSGVTNLVDFSGGRLSLLSVRIDPSASIIGKTLAEAGQIYDMEYRAVAISRNGTTIIPRGSECFQAGDMVYVVTNPAGIKKLLKHSGKMTTRFKNVMILGGTPIGRLVAKELGKNYHVKLFEKDPELAYQLSGELNHALVVNADGTRMESLVEEGVNGVDSFIAVTGNAETNIISCLLARNLGVKHTIAEIENLDYLNLAEKLGIDTVINKKLIAASHIFRFTMSGKMVMMRTLTGTEAEVFEFEVQKGARVTKAPVSSLSFPHQAIMGGVIRGNTGFIVTGDTQVKPGDHVVVFAMPEAVHEVSRMFC